MDSIKYHLVLEFNYARQQWQVKITDPPVTNGDWDYYLSVIFESNMEPIVEEMSAWCRERGVGRRTAYDTFMFKKEAGATMFILRFQ
jgi:hypothetical protein